MNENRGTLLPSEPHPMAKDAYSFIISIGVQELWNHLDAFSSCAIEGNRMAEICAETLRRVLRNEPVSDRYILGLAWYFKKQ